MDFEYVDFIPVRPSNHDLLRITVGLFRNYGVLPFPGPSGMMLTLEDPSTHRLTSYMLAEDTTLNGHSLVCSSYKTYGSDQLCAALPDSIIAGQTYVGVVYWENPFQGFAVDGADTLVTCTSPDQCMQQLSPVR
jgi:hypothetical protein